MNQNNSQRVVKLVFTQEQIEERNKLIADLENGTADIAFEGSFLEAKAFLAGIDQLVDSHPH